MNMQERYLKALSLVPFNVEGKVKNEKIFPVWIDESNFYYKRDADNGAEYVQVDAKTGNKTPLFDHEVMAKVLSNLLGQEVNPNQFPIDIISYFKSELKIRLLPLGKEFIIDMEGQTAKESVTYPVNYLLSPDMTKAIIKDGYNLKLRDLKTGNETPLTSDGTKAHDYGKSTDHIAQTSELKQEGEASYAPVNTYWLKDNRHVFVSAVENMHIDPFYYVDCIPTDGSQRPKFYEARMPFFGEKEDARVPNYIIDTETNKSVEITRLEGFDFEYKFNVLQPPIYITDDDKYLFFLINDQYVKNVKLVKVDVKTGEMTPLIEESNEETTCYFNSAQYSTPNVRVIKKGAEAIWFSESDGWAHLYRYDLTTGKLLNQITKGEFVTADIVSVDEENEIIYFSACGMKFDMNMYHRYLYKIGLDGEGMTLLTDEVADHEYVNSVRPMSALMNSMLSAMEINSNRISPKFEYLVDTYSTTNQPPKTVLRNIGTGELISTIEDADPTVLLQMGYRPPEEYIVKAADGETDLVAVVYLPPDFDPTKKYKVIDNVYGGPQVLSIPRNYFEAHGGLGMSGGAITLESRAEFPQLGFICVMIESRGTRLRKKSISDYRYNNFGDFGLNDRICGIKQLAEKLPYFDIEDGVGITGHSYGGYGSLRGMLMHSDFYSVAVSSSGMHGRRTIYKGEMMSHQPEIFANGTYTTDDNTEITDFDRTTSNYRLAENLKGKLLLVYGALDANCPYHQQMRVVDALNKANKTYDLLVFPTEGHFYGMTASAPYFLRRRYDFFVQHLLKQEPPTHV